MSAYTDKFGQVAISAAALLAAMTMTACAPRYSAPVQVQASNPTVTYQYRNDNELLQANQQAAGFCSQYQLQPRTLRFGEGQDSKIVVFECIQGAPVAAQYPPAVVAPVATPVSWDGYYDDYYGPFYDGYWGSDGYFYYSLGVGQTYRRDDGRHFQHEVMTGYHPVHGFGGRPR